MRVYEQTNYPILAKLFKNQRALADLIHCSERTVRRSMSGNRKFDEWELRTIENYTGVAREVFLRRTSKC